MYENKNKNSVYLKIRYVFEDKWITDADLSSYFVVHGVDICLVYCHTLLGQRRGIVYRDIM